MSNLKNGGPAFPSHGSMGEVTHEGMSLRDYFAAKAMQGMCSNGDSTHRGDDVIAQDAYSIADAMLRAREA